MDNLADTFPMDNTPGTARDMGPLSAVVVSHSDSVGPFDPQDYYAFEMRSAGIATILLTGLAQDADLELYDSNGQLLQFSRSSNTVPDQIVRSLSAGLYYARVYPYGYARTNYRIEFSATGQGPTPTPTPTPSPPAPSPLPSPDDGAGNSRETAREIGSLSATVVSYSDAVGPSDRDDYYVFEMQSAGTARVLLTGLAQDADLELYDSNGQLLQFSRSSNTAPDQIIRSLSAGRYYARVYPFGSARTNYRIEFSATGQATTPTPTPNPSPTPPGPEPTPGDAAGNTRATAREVGSLSDVVVSLSDAVGPTDRDDYYAFEMRAAGTATILLTDLAQDADLELYDGRGQLLQFSRSSNTTPDQIMRNLSAGRYYARVSPYGQAATSYRIEFSATGQGARRIPVPVYVDFWSSEPRFSELWAFESPSGKDAEVVSAFRSFTNGPAAGISNLNRGENIVAVIDTGVRLTHEDLQGNLLPGYDFSGDGDPDPVDTQGHGTHVAGTIAAAPNGKGVIGANPVAKILPIKVFADGATQTSSIDVIEGINYAVEQGAKIINLSLGGSTYNQAYYNALEAAGDAGVLIVAAAGNSGTDNDVAPHYPASYDLSNIISVAASDQSDQLAGFSNYGNSSVDVMAPGVSILSLGNTGDSSYTMKQGTSMATPLVSGIMSAFWARNPGFSPSGLRQKLMSSVDPLGTNSVASGGRVNMAKLFGITSALFDEITGVEADQEKGLSNEFSSSLVDTKAFSGPVPESLLKHSTVEGLDGEQFAVDEVIVFIGGSSAVDRSRNASAIRSKFLDQRGYGACLSRFVSFEALGGGMVALGLQGDPAQKLDALERMLLTGVIDSFELPAIVELV